MKILEYLRSVCTHPTVDEVYVKLHPGLPTLSRTTVYNTLKLLAEKGIDTVLLACSVSDFSDREHIESLWENTVTLDTLAVNGKDITDRGIPAGKEVGEILKALLTDVNSGFLTNERESLLSALSKKLRFLGKP
jgi:hypothetical protein